MNYLDTMNAQGYGCYMVEMGAVFAHTKAEASAFALENDMTDEPLGGGRFDSKATRAALELKLDSAAAQHRLGVFGNMQAFDQMLRGD